MLSNEQSFELQKCIYNAEKYMYIRNIVVSSIVFSSSIIICLLSWRKK